MKALNALSLASLLTLAVHATEVPTLSEDAQRAYALLLREPTFSDEAIGIGGITPASVKAFRVLISDPKADSAFKRLLANGTLAGRIYALCGLFFTDYAYFQTAIQPYRRSQQRVETQFGCVGGQLPVAHIIESHAPNALRLNGPGQTREEWLRATGKDGYSLDVLGGGYPKLIRNVP